MNPFAVHKKLKAWHKTREKYRRKHSGEEFFDDKSTFCNSSESENSDDDGGL